MPTPTPDAETREQLLGMVFDRARDMMVLSKVDPEELFRVVSVNDSYLQVARAAGYEVIREELEGRTFGEVMVRLNFAPEMVEQIRERYLEVLRTGRRVDYEEVVTTPGGVFYGECTITPLLDEDGRCAWFLYSMRDVTQERRAELARRESDAKYATSFRLSPAAMLLADQGTGEILEVNEAFERITGFKRDEVLGRTALSLGIIEGKAERDERAARILAQGEIRDEPGRFRRKDGMWVDAISWAALVEVDGRKCILNTVEDITDRLRAEKERIELERHFRQSQKLEALGTLAGGIAHDFNNILTSLLGHCELSLREVPPQSEVKGRLESIRRSGLRARDLVRRILTFSRQQAQEHTDLMLDGLLLEVKLLLESSSPPSIRVELDVPDEVRPVSGDSSQLHQVFLNLGTNAAHAMRERGGVLGLDLCFATIAPEQAAAIGLLESGDYAVIKVRDEGHGMSPEIRHRIFEPFFTTKPIGEGTGLGLAMVQGIVTDHHGAVTVESTEGKGTTLAVYLPVQRTATIGRGLFEGQMPQGTGERVLVVDDEPGVGELMSRLLQCIGYRVEVCKSAETAWALFRVEPTRFDLLLTDLTMPGWNGLELVRHVRELRPDLPVCLMSGYAGNLSRDDMRRLGVSEFIGKPPELRVLARKLHAALHPAATD